jgi:hypothetical protein
LAIVLSFLLSFGHCVVFPSVFWPLCCLSFCLLAIVLSFLLRFTDSNCPFGIFKLFLVYQLFYVFYCHFWFSQICVYFHRSWLFTVVLLYCTFLLVCYVSLA